VVLDTLGRIKTMDITTTLTIVQVTISAIVSFNLGKSSKELKHAINFSTMVAFFLPILFFIFPYFVEPAALQKEFFLKWFIYGFVANTFVAFLASFFGHFSAE
jgi:hypothetical protein